MTAAAPVRAVPAEYAPRADLGTSGKTGLRTVGADRSAAQLRLLWTRRRLLVKTAVLGLVAGTLLAFLLPKRFSSAVKLMPPNPQPGQGAAMMAALSAKSGMPAMVGNLLGVDGSGALFVGILESRTIQDRLVTRFDLKKVYWDRLEEDACKELALRTGISEDRKNGIITIAVSDSRPERAAAIAQAYVEELDRLSAELSTSAAHRERVFLEERLRAVKLDLDEASRDLSQFASQNSAIDIKEQGRTMVEAAARLQGELIAAQSQIKGLEEIYSANNVRVRSVEARIGELEKQLDKLDGGTAGTGTDGTGATGTSGEGRELAGPFHARYPSIRQLPLLGARYADLYRSTRIQEAVYETLTQQYELAKVQEAKETPSVKVLDQASLPQRKSSPSRLAWMFLLASVGLAIGVAGVMLQSRWEEIEATHPHKLLVQDACHAIRTGVSEVTFWGPSRSLKHRIRARFYRRRDSSKFPA
jgi:capsule polysaccharide export protein KpsE/RkpR